MINDSYAKNFRTGSVKNRRKDDRNLGVESSRPSAGVTSNGQIGDADVYGREDDPMDWESTMPPHQIALCDKLGIVSGAPTRYK